MSESIGPKIAEALTTPLSFKFNLELSSPAINLSGCRAELCMEYSNGSAMTLHLDDADMTALAIFLTANGWG